MPVATIDIPLTLSILGGLVTLLTFIGSGIWLAAKLLGTLMATQRAISEQAQLAEKGLHKLSKSIDHLFQSVSSLNASLQVMQSRHTTINNAVDDHETRLRTLEKPPQSAPHSSHIWTPPHTSEPPEPNE